MLLKFETIRVKFLYVHETFLQKSFIEQENFLLIHIIQLQYFNKKGKNTQDIFHGKQNIQRVQISVIIAKYTELLIEVEDV